MIALETTDYAPLIHKFYGEDKELISKYHVLASEETTKEQCAEHTLKEFRESVCNFRFFRLADEKDLIGYFGAEQMDNYNVLTGFFIRPKFRKTTYIRKFWRIIDKHFEGKTYFCGIYEKNSRAIMFLKRKGYPNETRIVGLNKIIVFKIN